MIKKILVANRDEIAMRIFRTCRVMNISTVAVYTHVDRGALHVRYAEEAYCISESPEDTSYLKNETYHAFAKTGTLRLGIPGDFCSIQIILSSCRVIK